MWRRDPAGIASVPQSRHRPHRHNGVNINFDSFENPPFLFAWDRTSYSKLAVPSRAYPNTVSKLNSSTKSHIEVATQTDCKKIAPESSNAVQVQTTSDTSKLQTNKVSHAIQCELSIPQVTPKYCKETPKIPAKPEKTDIPVSATPTNIQSTCFDVPAKAHLHDTQQEEPIVSPSDSKQKQKCHSILKHSKTKILYPSHASINHSTTRSIPPQFQSQKELTDYWEWLHWYSSWQLHYRENKKMEPRNPMKPPIISTPPASWWVDVSTHAASECNPQREKHNTTPRISTSMPYPTSVAKSAQRRSAQFVEPVVPLPPAPISTIQENPCAQDIIDTKLTLEELAA